MNRYRNLRIIASFVSTFAVISIFCTGCAKAKTQANELAGGTSDELRIDSVVRLSSKPVELEWRTARREPLRFDLETCIPGAGQCLPDMRIECTSARTEACRIFAMRAELEGEGSIVGAELAPESASLEVTGIGEGAIYKLKRPRSNLLSIQNQIVRIRASHTLPQGGIEEGPWTEEKQEGRG